MKYIILFHFARWNPAKRPSAQQALRYPYFHTGTNKQPNGHIMEQTLQRSYARKSGMLHHQVLHLLFIGEFPTFVLCSTQPMTGPRTWRRW